MIRDARVLRPEFIPNEVRHRDPEVTQLSNALDPITAGDRAETALLFGPSGAGKTCIAQFTVDRLRETVLDIEHQYVNCWRDYSRFRALYRILDGVDRALDVHRQSTPTDELLERLREYDGPPYVVVLDEVDQLQDKSVLYDLHGMPRIELVLIANREEELFAPLDDRLTSRLQAGRRVRFEKYAIDELVAILRDRIRWGLAPDAIADVDLEYIADAAAGDARVAINVLRSAARDAERANLDRIPPDVVRDAVPDAKAEIERKNVEKLTEHQRVLYDIVAEHGEISPGELYGQYRERVDDPKTDRTVRNYLQKMCHYNLVVAEGENRARTYRLPE